MRQDGHTYVYVVFRVDVFEGGRLREPSGIAEAIKVKEVFTSEEMAAEDVARLNHGLEEKPYRYFWQRARYYEARRGHC